jgi:hypothetical protein
MFFFGWFLFVGDIKTGVLVLKIVTSPLKVNNTVKPFQVLAVIKLLYEKLRFFYFLFLEIIWLK